MAKEKVYGSDGSQAVPAPPSCKGRLELRGTKINLHYAYIHTVYFFQMVTHIEHSAFPLERPTDYFEQYTDPLNKLRGKMQRLQCSTWR
jgi:hypothetical protein